MRTQDGVRLIWLGAAMALLLSGCAGTAPPAEDTTGGAGGGTVAEGSIAPEIEAFYRESCDDTLSSSSLDDAREITAEEFQDPELLAAITAS